MTRRLLTLAVVIVAAPVVVAVEVLAWLDDWALGEPWDLSDD